MDCVTFKVVIGAPIISIARAPLYMLPFCECNPYVDNALLVIFAPAYFVDETLRPSRWERSEV